MVLAQWLERQPKVRKVHYPGLSSHPQHQIACEQMPKFGAVLTFELDDRRAAEEFSLNLALCSFAASLGGPRTTLQVPAFMAFLDAGPEERAKMSVVDGMVRVCVGLEDVEDIIADFDQGLATV